VPRNTITSNRQRAASLSRTLKARSEARREVRRKLGEWLRGVGSETPDDPSISPAAAAEWSDEVKRIAARLMDGKPC